MEKDKIEVDEVMSKEEFWQENPDLLMDFIEKNPGQWNDFLEIPYQEYLKEEGVKEEGE